ncbi:MAG: hypothetical protein AAB484_01015 [Patescibacteria group bacterium]
MNTKIHLNKKTIIFALSLFAVFALGSQAKAASIFDIEFPIAELGNCKDKTECKAYCEIADNESACQSFAAKYGINQDDDQSGATNDRQEKIMKDGGPGNCAKGSDNPEKTCRQYCSVQTNMRECVSYARERGLMKGRDLEEAEKVLKALDSGATLPAGCTDEESCRNTCENPKDVSVMRACFDFAEKAGLLPPNVDRAQAEKMFSLIESGKAPFKSPKDFEQCENPANDEILDKCINFAIENGFIPPEEVEMIKKTGGRGPGGCRGREQCETYCATNNEECFKFAEKHDLISPEDRQRMTEGSEKMKASLEDTQEGQYGRDMQGPPGERSMGERSQYGKNRRLDDKFENFRDRPETMNNFSPEQQKMMEEKRAEFEKSVVRPEMKPEDAQRFMNRDGQPPSSDNTNYYPPERTYSQPQPTGSYTPPSGGSYEGSQPMMQSSPPPSSMSAPTSRRSGSVSNAATLLFSQVMGLFER